MPSLRPSAFALSAVALALTMSGCSPAPTPSPSPSCSSSTGVSVVVNFSGVFDASDIAACAPLADGTATVADALAAVGITTEGTVKYGDQVVCRVNSLPAADKPFIVPGHDPYTEPCKDMAPEYAYWALWVKSGSGKWDYAAEGVSTQKVKPGDSIGLVFTTGGATPTPVAG